MKITVVGLGAVGGLLAARLALAGHAVSGLARGATLRAVAERGLRLQSHGEELAVRIAVSDNAMDLGTQDLIVIALKGQALPAAAGALQALIAPHTVLLPAMNGVPWWFLRLPPASDRLTASEQRLHSVDPQGGIEAALPLAQVLGCVVHLTCAQAAPGVVTHGFGDRLIVGEPAGGPSPRVEDIAAVLSSAGFQAERSTDIRSDIWFKLWGNMTMNPVSALTGATCDLILDDPDVRGFVLRAMAEAAAIGARIGCPIRQSGEERIAVARRLGRFKTSMLQDAEAGRTLEIDALIGAVQEIGSRVGVATPHISALLGLIRLMARTRGLNAGP